jgi:uncharacterized protein (TIGR02118 family)
MIKVSVLYPKSDGATFDIDYYCKRHMPMVRDKLGLPLQGIAVEQGVDGPYIAAGHLFFESVDAFKAAFDPHAQAIMADMPNYTNTKPAVQVAEVKLNASRGETGDLHLH